MVAPRLEAFERFPAELCRRIRFVLSDVDDTLTDGPRLAAATYAALERLQRAGVAVIPVTAAPAGWCDLMCRLWPVAAVIGENGGLCFRHDGGRGMTERRYWLMPRERDIAARRLAALGTRLPRPCRVRRSPTTSATARRRSLS